jgi:hypothetical protein
MLVESNPGVGTCDAAYFSNTNTVLIFSSGALLLVIVVRLPCGVFGAGGIGGAIQQVGGWWAAIGTLVMIFVLFAATFVVGFLTLISQGIDQHNAFQMSLICAMQIWTVFLYLLG